MRPVLGLPPLARKRLKVEVLNVQLEAVANVRRLLTDAAIELRAKEKHDRRGVRGQVWHITHIKHIKMFAPWGAPC